MHHVQDNYLPWPDLTERVDYDLNFEADKSGLSGDALLESLVVEGDFDGSDASGSCETSEMSEVERFGFEEYVNRAAKLEAGNEYGRIGNACDSESCSSVPESTPSVFKFVDESEQFAKKRKPETACGDVEEVRLRIKRRNNRPTKTESKTAENSRRMRNTMAARRYRERQRKDVEVLDERIKQVEEELRNAKLEILWWKMESNKWKEEAQRKQDGDST